MSTDGRRQPRRSVDARIDVVDIIAEETIGHVGNLSAGGMLLVCNRPLGDDALYQVRFALPDGDATLELGAHVLWQAPASAPGQSWVGLRFVGASPDASLRLRRWSDPDGLGH